MKNSLEYVALVSGAVAAIVILSLPGSIAGIETSLNHISAEKQTAATFFVESLSVAQIQNDYRTASAPIEKKVKILIVPGHQPALGGTEFGSVHEHDIVMEIADALASLLAQNSRYEVMVSRTKTAWSPILQDYFDTNAAVIDTFRQKQQRQMALYIANGSFILEPNQVTHNAASSVAALQLYGINKWTSENNIHITLHLHLNDHAGHRSDVVGKYTGFAVYVPDRQYSNANVSRAIGEAIAWRINAYHATSTLPQEDIGVVEGRGLIATGANNTVDNASLLIEYGYIYEPQFQNASVRSLAVADYANATYLGLQDFFKDPVATTYGSAALPYDWTNVTALPLEKGAGIYALQSALHYLGYYPPAIKSFSECPISGIVDACTTNAIKAYQRARGLEMISTLDPATRRAIANDFAQ